MLADPISQNYLLLAPQASTSPGETHAALVVSQQGFTDVRFSAGFETLEQLRTGSTPNPWESAWAVFDYQDNTHFYYVAFKPNGWELGKADPAYPGAQRFLATGSTPVSAIGTEHSFDIQQDGNVIKVWLDGELLTTFTDNERPYLGGKVGFYTEDAKVAFDNVSGSIAESFEGFATQSFSDGATLGSAWETAFVGYGYGAIASDGTSAPDDPAARPAPSAHFARPLSAAPTRTITGTSADDRLYGSWRHELIDGRGGVDRMAGRGGDDTYRVSGSAVRVVEGSGGGIDTVRSTASSYTLSANVENLELIGAARQTGVGNALDNVLVSNGVGGTLRGGDGHDLLVSGKGSDILTGGGGSDTFIFTDMASGSRRITDYQPGVDDIDLHQVLSAYAGADPFGDGVLELRANGQGGTDVLVDPDGAGSAAAVLVVALDGAAPGQVLESDLFWF